MKSRFVFLLKQRSLDICPGSVGSVESMKCATEAWRRQIAVNMLLHTRLHIVTPAVHYSQPPFPFFFCPSPFRKQAETECKPLQIDPSLDDALQTILRRDSFFKCEGLPFPICSNIFINNCFTECFECETKRKQGRA